MAQRRMFTKQITDDDSFVTLSSSAQALYLHLMMSADDDGFSNQISMAMFKAHASVGDLQQLLEKRYVYQFENGVIVIKHFRMANALRKDRYTPTVYQEELKKLFLKDNGAYKWLPNGCQMVANRLPQDSIGQVSIEEDNISSPPISPPKQKFNLQHAIDNYTLNESVRESLRAFFEMRETKKVKATERAVNMILKKLDDLAMLDDELKIKILNQSTMSGWAGIFPYKGDAKQHNSYSRDRSADFIAKMEAYDKVISERGGV